MSTATPTAGGHPAPQGEAPQAAPQAGPTPHLLHTYNRKAPQFVRGQGAKVWDAEGRMWIDALAGIAVNGLGHGHEGLALALADQARQVLHLSNLYRHPAGEELADRLCALTGMGAVFFSNSGSEANECALKIARKAATLHDAANPDTPRGRHFVALEGGFHGRTAGSLSVTANAKYREPFGPLLEAQFIAPEDLGALESALATRPAGLILEPLQGEGGLRTLSNEYLRAARELCTQTGTVLIADEVQCGCGRTGTFLASEAAGITPDLVTLAKPLAAGVPIGATLVSGCFTQVLQPGDHGSTFGGGPLAARAALVFLDEYEARLAAAIPALGTQLAAGLDALVAASPLVSERRGRGLMQGLVVPGRAGELADRCFDAGLLVCTAAADVVRLVPPFVITPEELDAALGILQSTLSAMESPSKETAS